MAAVAELICYPVKGCAGTSVREAVVTPAGLRHDRSFMVVGEDGVFRTQRREPGLARVRPRIDDAGESLTLTAPGFGALHIDVDVTADRREVFLFGAPFRGIDQGDAAAAWFSEFLGVRSRLVRVPPEHDRITEGETAGTAGYADSTAVLVASLSSLDLLNDLIAERGGEPLPMDRFRPNIVVGGWPEPHVEDRARRLTAGDAELAFAKLARRCVVTTVDQQAGRKAGPEPIRTLARYRRTTDGGVAFGARFATSRPGPVAVGARVRVTAWEHAVTTVD